MSIEYFCIKNGFSRVENLDIFHKIYNTHVKGVYISDEMEDKDIMIIFSKKYRGMLHKELIDDIDWVKYEIENLNN